MCPKRFRIVFLLLLKLFIVDPPSYLDMSFSLSLTLSRSRAPPFLYSSLGPSCNMRVS